MEAFIDKLVRISYEGNEDSVITIEGVYLGMEKIPPPDGVDKSQKYLNLKDVIRVENDQQEEFEFRKLSVSMLIAANFDMYEIFERSFKRLPEVAETERSNVSIPNGSRKPAVKPTQPLHLFYKVQETKKIKEAEIPENAFPSNVDFRNTNIGRQNHLVDIPEHNKRLHMTAKSNPVEEGLNYMLVDSQKSFKMFYDFFVNRFADCVALSLWGNDIVNCDVEYLVLSTAYPLVFCFDLKHFDVFKRERFCFVDHILQSNRIVKIVYDYRLIEPFMRLNRVRMNTDTIHDIQVMSVSCMNAKSGNVPFGMPALTELLFPLDFANSKLEFIKFADPDVPKIYGARLSTIDPSLKDVDAIAQYVNWNDRPLPISVLDLICVMNYVMIEMNRNMVTFIIQKNRQCNLITEHLSSSGNAIGSVTSRLLTPKHFESMLDPKIVARNRNSTDHKLDQASNFRYWKDDVTFYHGLRKYYMEYLDKNVSNAVKYDQMRMQPQPEEVAHSHRHHHERESRGYLFGASNGWGEVSPTPISSSQLPAGSGIFGDDIVGVEQKRPIPSQSIRRQTVDDNVEFSNNFAIPEMARANQISSKKYDRVLAKEAPRRENQQLLRLSFDYDDGVNFSGSKASHRDHRAAADRQVQDDGWGCHRHDDYQPHVPEQQTDSPWDDNYDRSSSRYRANQQPPQRDDHRNNRDHTFERSRHGGSCRY